MAISFAPDQTFWLLIAVLWMLPWKGWALWRAARNGQRIWFFVLMLVHTLGILEMVYLAFWSGLRFGSGKMKKKSSGAIRKNRK